MTGCVVQSNSAKNDGGGIYSKGSLSIIQSTLQGNIADSDTYQYGDGGALFQIRLALSASSRAASSPTRRYTGGAVRIVKGAVATVGNSTFSGNTARQNGGAFSVGSGQAR